MSVSTIPSLFLSKYKLETFSVTFTKFGCEVLTGVNDDDSSSVGLPAAGENELDAELSGDTSNDEVESCEMSYGESVEDSDSQQLSLFCFPLDFAVTLADALLALLSHECSRHFLAVILLLWE